MYNQSFTIEVLQEIFDKENRKGKNIEKRYQNDFQNSLELTKEIKEINRKLRFEKVEASRISLYEDKKEARRIRDTEIGNVFDEVLNRISKKKTISLTVNSAFSKPTYSLENTLEDFFISKKIQLNIYKGYGVRQSNRYTILCQLTNALKDNFPKYVIRTDIRSFYETIPQAMLRHKLNSDNLLSARSKFFINQTLDAYNDLTGQTDPANAQGVPRGVGFSAYLAELFMRKVDNKLKKMNDLVYFARYVDDIILVFTPTSKDVSSDYLQSYLEVIKEIVTSATDGFMKLNESKTRQFNLLKDLSDIDPNIGNKKIEFLGYKILSKGSNKIVIQLSDNKINKYKRKIRLAFEAFHSKKDSNRKRAFKLLIARLQYLSANTKLKNNKAKVFIGIYYSNSFLNSDESLKTLQTYQNWYIQRANLTDREKEKVYLCDYIAGFKQKRFFNLPLKKKTYNNHNNSDSDNRGILQYGLIEINSIWK